MDSLTSFLKNAKETALVTVTNQKVLCAFGVVIFVIVTYSKNYRVKISGNITSLYTNISRKFCTLLQANFPLYWQKILRIEITG
jgi:hypothetical protein